MADNLLKRLSNAAVAENGNLLWRIETRSGVLDVECGKDEVPDIFTFLAQIAAVSPAGTSREAAESFASLPLNRIGLQAGPGSDEMTLLVQTLGDINLGFRLPKSQFQRFVETINQMAQSQR